MLFEWVGVVGLDLSYMIFHSTLTIEFILAALLAYRERSLLSSMPHVEGTQGIIDPLRWPRWSDSLVSEKVLESEQAEVEAKTLLITKRVESPGDY